MILDGVSISIVDIDRVMMLLYSEDRKKKIWSLNVSLFSLFIVVDPGPGAYNVFSEFSMYGPKVAKTEPNRKTIKEEDVHEEEESKVKDEDNENNKNEEGNKGQQDTYRRQLRIAA